jgi:hypothetical protein
MPAGAQPQTSRATTREQRPAAEPVLPWIAYFILLAEAALLTWFYGTHEVSPADPIGHAIGWVGTGSMVAMHVYSIRRRVRALRSWGRLSSWLHLHIFLGLQGALLVTFHSLHLSALFNISGATIMLTLIVVASGAFGRYLYSWLPKSLSGDRLEARDIEAELTRLEPEVAAGLAAHPELAAAASAIGARTALTGRIGFAALVAEDRRTRKALAAIDRALAKVGPGPKDPRYTSYAAALRRRATLTRRLTGFTAAERMFRSWHLFHKPLTFLLLGTVVLHVVAHYIYAARFSG